MSAHVARGSRGSIVYPEGTYYSRPSSGVYGPDPRGSAASVISNRSTGRPRRASVSAPRPARAHSPPPVSRHIDAYNARLEPHSSSLAGRPRRGSVYGPSSAPSVRPMDPRSSAPSIRTSDLRASAPPVRTSDLRASSSSARRSSDEDSRRGSTRFPRKFVNREAAEETGWPFEEDRETGAIVVFKALSKKDIDELIERTAIIRRRRAERDHRHDPRSSSDRHVAFAPVKTIITHDDRPRISGAIPAVRGPNTSEQRTIDKNLSELERKAAAANEARIRAEEVAKMVRTEEGAGRRRGRDVIVVR